MKYIFDFDDVIFNNTKQFKEHMYATLEKAGISREKAKGNYYDAGKTTLFSLKRFITQLLERENMDVHKTDEIYEKIMKECPNFVNLEILEAIQKIGKENCYIVTNGDEQFQRDKLTRSGVISNFLSSHIFVTSGSKRNSIDRIYKENENDELVFIDDKEHYFQGLEKEKYPRLTTIHYKKSDFKRLFKIKDEINSELKKR